MAGEIPSPDIGHGGPDSRCHGGISSARWHAGAWQKQEGRAARDASAVPSGQIRRSADGGSSDGGAGRRQGGHWPSRAGAELADGRVGSHEIILRNKSILNLSDLTLFFVSTT